MLFVFICVILVLVETVAAVAVSLSIAGFLLYRRNAFITLYTSNVVQESVYALRNIFDC